MYRFLAALAAVLSFAAFAGSTATAATPSLVVYRGPLRAIANDPAVTLTTTDYGAMAITQLSSVGAPESIVAVHVAPGEATHGSS